MGVPHSPQKAGTGGSIPLPHWPQIRGTYQFCLPVSPSNFGIGWPVLGSNLGPLGVGGSTNCGTTAPHWPQNLGGGLPRLLPHSPQKIFLAPGSGVKLDDDPAPEPEECAA